MSGWKLSISYAFQRLGEPTYNVVRELRSDGKERAIWIMLSPVGRGPQADDSTDLDFFDAEKEAAQAYLEALKEHPEAKYHQSEYSRAITLTTDQIA